MKEVFDIIAFNIIFYLSLIINLFIILILIIFAKKRPEKTLSWILILIIFPPLGLILFVLLGRNWKVNTLDKKSRQKVSNLITPSLLNKYNITNEYEPIINLLVSNSSSPLFVNNTITILDGGASKFEILKSKLLEAKDHIHLEYYIVKNDNIGNEIKDILIKKSKEGIKVKFIIDKMGSIKLSSRYIKDLKNAGVDVAFYSYVLAPFFRLINTQVNYRNHRKIVVIDGDVGFTGGINLADEYINEYEKHGYWKDAGIMLKGDAVWNLTVMFLSMWDYIDNKEEDYIKFKPSKNKYYNSKGYVQPFDDSPLINEPIGETVYLNLINKAKDYIYINTPYLIIDNEMATALKIAAKSGVDIKIVTPYIPDKKFVHAVTKSYYESFIKDGIEIYEFTPGFMHAKTFVVDDEYGVVGSINLDFRSLYLHYECGVWLYKTDSIKSMKDDYLETLKRCHKVTMEECKNTSSIRKVLRLIIRMFAPLL